MLGRTRTQVNAKGGLEATSRTQLITCWIPESTTLWHPKWIWSFCRLPRRSLGFRMRRKEVPKNIRRYDSRIRIEVRIKRHIARNVHRIAIPFMNASDQFVKLHFGISTAMGRIFLDHRGDVSVSVAQGCGHIEA